MEYEFERATGLLVLEAVSSNINGNPDAESDPRQRPNGLGEVSAVSVKRKMRDLLEDNTSPFFNSLPPKFRDNPDSYCILESRGRKRDKIIAELGDEKHFDADKFAESTFVKKYWDARVFGNTFLEKGADKGYIKTGVIQIGTGLSVSPINIIRHTNTNKAGVEEGKDQGMAPMAYRVVEHAVYCVPFFVNPNMARKTGCTADDIELFKFLLPYIYDMNRSAVRPDVRVRHAWYVEHKNLLGSCPDYLILEALTPERVSNPNDPSESWKDYLDKNGLPPEILARVKSCVDLAAL